MEIDIELRCRRAIAFHGIPLNLPYRICIVVQLCSIWVCKTSGLPWSTRRCHKDCSCSMSSQPASNGFKINAMWCCTFFPPNPTSRSGTELTIVLFADKWLPSTSMCWSQVVWFNCNRIIFSSCVSMFFWFFLCFSILFKHDHLRNCVDSVLKFILVQLNETLRPGLRQLKALHHCWNAYCCTSPANTKKWCAADERTRRTTRCWKILDPIHLRRPTIFAELGSPSILPSAPQNKLIKPTKWSKGVLIDPAEVCGPSDSSNSFLTLLKIKIYVWKQDAAHEPDCSHVEHFCGTRHLNRLGHFSPLP